MPTFPTFHNLGEGEGRRKRPRIVRGGVGGGGDDRRGGGGGGGGGSPKRRRREGGGDLFENNSHRFDMNAKEAFFSP